MTRNHQLRRYLRLQRLLRRRRVLAVDPLGFGFSRAYNTTDAATVPDGVDLHFFTGRTHRKATR